MGVMDRARQAIPSADGRDWLDDQKDELIRSATPLAILDVNFDQGGKFGARWVVAVEGFYDDVEVEGKLSFGANPTRNPMFEELQAMVEEAEAAGESGIGPICLIKGKSQGGYRYYTFADYDEKTGQPILPQQAQQPDGEQNGRRRSRPPVAQTRRSMGQRQHEDAAETPPAEDGEPPVRRRGRPPGSGRRQTATPVAEPAQAGVDARPRAAVPVPEGGAERAQEQVGPQGAVGQATCPHCEQELTGRVFANEEGEGVVMIHRCPKTQRPEVLPAEITA